MPPLKVDLLGGEAERKARKTTAVIAVVFAVAVGLLSAVGAGASYRAAKSGTDLLTEVGNLPIISDIRRLAWGGGVGGGFKTPDDRLTFLIMGIGGPGHAGSQLSDTILLATLDLKTKEVGMLSIPRDLAFPLGGSQFIKINAVNAYAEQSNPGHGAREAADAFEDLLGIRIDHVIKIDFNAFVELIDAVGGIDVNVERSFVDYEYPTEDDRWQTISFEEGEQHMDGETALKYVRSRHGSNGEGSDFARSRRQQIVMLAVKDKLLSLGTATNPSRIIKLYEAVSSNIQTDLTPWEAIKLAPLAKEFSPEHITMHVLTNAPDGELVSSSVNDAYMLFPRDRDWSEIREIAQHPFSTKEEMETEIEPDEPVSVELRNGTTITGFASRISTKLKQEGYVVNNIGNASERGYDKTVIYDLTKGERSEQVSALAGMLDGTVATSLPAWSATSAEGIHRPTDNETDILIILGSESYDLVNPNR